MVIFFHAFARWEDLMPYQNQFNGFHLFKYGKFGVQLFFIISGFVILMTLENCHSFSDFIYRRWLRLFPAMLICTIFIFFTAAYFPYRPSGQPNIGQLIPGLLFLDPEIIKLMFNQEYMAIEGSFWSLFVEVKFYIIAGVLFFYLGKKRMILSVALLFLMSTAHVKLGQITVVPEYIDTIIKSLSIEHFGWFAAGAIVVIVLARMGIVPIDKLKEFRGYFIVLAFIIAAVITPPDVVSQLALAIPMVILYEVGIIAAQFFIKHTKAPEEAAEEGAKP